MTIHDELRFAIEKEKAFEELCRLEWHRHSKQAAEERTLGYLAWIAALRSTVRVRLLEDKLRFASRVDDLMRRWR